MFCREPSLLGYWPKKATRKCKQATEQRNTNVANRTDGA
jgi:hypothetical protein